jgi:hypothetical protein
MLSGYVIINPPMFQYLRLRKEPQKYAPDATTISSEQLQQDPSIPVTLRQINQLPENAVRRIYRGLLPPSLLAKYGIDPIRWKQNGQELVRLSYEPGGQTVKLGVKHMPDDPDEFIQIEIGDNAMNGIDLLWLVLSDPESRKFPTDQDELGNPLTFGSLHRNLATEVQSKQAGLAPAQVRSSLGASGLALGQIESFLSLLGHRAYFLEPLTYASAWVFERRGFAYVRGHKLMDQIQREFQPGGILHTALDGQTPFRQPDQCCTVRGRAWAIHDGILEQLGATWNDLRMVKQIGRHAGVETFPRAIY